MKALISDITVVDIKDAQYEVPQPLYWVDCTPEVKIGWYYINNQFKPTNESDAILLQKAKDNKISLLNKYYLFSEEVNNSIINEIAPIKINENDVSYISKQLVGINTQIKLNPILEPTINFEYFYEGGSIELSLLQLRNLYITMLDIFNFNRKININHIAYIKNLNNIQDVESYDITSGFAINNVINV